MMTKRPSLVLLHRAGLMIGVIASVGLAFWNSLRNREHIYIRNMTTMLARSVQIDLSDEV